MNASDGGEILQKSHGVRKCGVAKGRREGQCGWRKEAKKECKEEGGQVRAQGPGGG